MERKIIVPIAKPIVNQRIVRGVTSVVRSGRWTQGKVVHAIEKQVAATTHATYAIAVSSGTAALHAMLSAYRFDKGDEVITSPFTFAATMNAIILSGAKPVFADITATDFNLDPEAVAKRITKKTKAILAVDLYGQPANYHALRNIADAYNLRLFGDCAQSLGATHGGKSQVSYCDGVIFSFYATKNVASAEGGIVVTNDESLAHFVSVFRNQGQTSQYTYEIPGLNYRMTDIHAVIASEQLQLLPKIVAKRNMIAERYRQALSKIHGLVLPTPTPGDTHVFHQFTIRVTDQFHLQRDAIKERLLEKGIQSMVYYPQPLHTLAYAAYLGYKKGDFPEAERASQEVLSLPMFYGLTRADQQYISTTLKHIATYEA